MCNRRWCVTLVALLLPLRVLGGEGEPASVEELLRRVDRQMTSKTRSALARMRIVTSEETREKQLRILARGEEDSLLLLLKPDRDKGTKYLKLAGQLWIYLPRTEKDVKISGHMLRQSLMGSDFSYEDLAENHGLDQDYDGALLPPEEMAGEPCHVVRLTAKRQGLSYPERKVWISKRYELPLLEERYAKTGRLLKALRLSNIRRFEDRYYPMLFVMEDKLKSGTRTELSIEEIRFGIPVAEEVFDRRSLRREVRF